VKAGSKQLKLFLISLVLRCVVAPDLAHRTMEDSRQVDRPSKLAARASYLWTNSFDVPGQSMIAR